ncbi:MAG: class I SAM-dependent methyltransferase [Patescibacteria group bacterium]|nr:class I SAM-dependent methyltransferase [Patescibacteria group bacterium]
MAYIFQKERILIRNRVADFISRFSIKGRVLDLGAGDVLRYKDLFKQADQYLTQDHREAANYKHDFVCDASRVPAPDASFDVIICTQVLEHVPNPFLVMEEAARLLRPGGRLILTVPQTNEIHEAPYDFFRYTKYGIMEMSKKCGLKVEEIHGLGDFWTMRVKEAQRFWIECLNLYSHPIPAKLFSVCFRMCYGLAEWSDNHLVPDRLQGRFTIGWAALLSK